jgi:hypothetical protein
MRLVNAPQDQAVLAARRDQDAEVPSRSQKQN